MKQKEIFMINEKEFKVPIFNITVLISLVDDLNDFVKYRQFDWKDVSEFGAYTYSKAGNRTAITAFGIVFEITSYKKGILVHETQHLADYILKYIGDGVNDGNEECRAYLQQWLFNRIKKIIKHFKNDRNRPKKIRTTTTRTK